ncbi:MAG: hypothetical protein JPMHGGIA_02123 [Saprospiraceae bacterium]|jgi:hypothetical protein|nr:hypothetical protein [Saprospiraceae bacterium]
MQTDVAPFGATSDRRIACADVALNGSHLRICEISPRIAASLLPLQNLANPAILYASLLKDSRPHIQAHLVFAITQSQNEKPKELEFFATARQIKSNFETNK